MKHGYPKKMVVQGRLRIVEGNAGYWRRKEELEEKMPPFLGSFLAELGMGDSLLASFARVSLGRVKLAYLCLVAFALLLSGCAKDRDHVIRVSVADQRMFVFDKGAHIATYPVSTSKFGLGDAPGSCRTPLGTLEVAKKIGKGAPIGMRFKDRRATGEIVPIDAPGRDPIVTRILWLRGLEPQNRRAYDRTIYIHGTAEERNVGQPVSYGCIRMRSRDVVALFYTVGVGARVEILPGEVALPSAPTPLSPDALAVSPSPVSRTSQGGRPN
jgi:hypothetical protein